MKSRPIETIIKMMESLPEHAQSQIVEQLRIYIQEIQDEIRWDLLFHKSQDKLIKKARQAKREIAQGKARPMEINRL